MQGVPRGRVVGLAGSDGGKVVAREHAPPAAAAAARTSPAHSPTTHQRARPREQAWGRFSDGRLEWERRSRNTPRRECVLTGLAQNIAHRSHTLRALLAGEVDEPCAVLDARRPRSGPASAVVQGLDAVDHGAPREHDHDHDHDEWGEADSDGDKDNEGHDSPQRPAPVSPRAPRSPAFKLLSSPKAARVGLSPPHRPFSPDPVAHARDLDDDDDHDDDGHDQHQHLRLPRSVVQCGVVVGDRGGACRKADGRMDGGSSHLRVPPHLPA